MLDLWSSGREYIYERIGISMRNRSSTLCESDNLVALCGAGFVLDNRAGVLLLRGIDGDRIQLSARPPRHSTARESNTFLYILHEYMERWRHCPNTFFQASKSSPDWDGLKPHRSNKV